MSKYGGFSDQYFHDSDQYGEVPSVSPYSVRIRENTDQKKTPLLDTFHAVQHCQGNREEDGLSQYL